MSLTVSKDRIILTVFLFFLQKPHFKNAKMKAWSPNSGNKERKATFLVLSRSDVHFDFESLTFTYTFGSGSKITRPKSWARKIRFVKTWKDIRTEISVETSTQWTKKTVEKYMLTSFIYCCKYFQFFSPINKLIKNKSQGLELKNHNH